MRRLRVSSHSFSAVRVGQLHVGDVAAHDLHAVAGQLTVEQVLHVLAVGTAQVVGTLGAHLAAALPDGVLHPAGQHEVEVAGADRLHEPDGVDDAEAQEELDGPHRDVLVRGPDSTGAAYGISVVTSTT